MRNKVAFVLLAFGATCLLAWNQGRGQVADTSTTAAMIVTQVPAAAVPDSPIDFTAYDAAKATYDQSEVDFKSAEDSRAQATTARDAAQAALDAAQADLDAAQADLETAADTSQAAWTALETEAQAVGLAPGGAAPAGAGRRIKR